MKTVGRIKIIAVTGTEIDNRKLTAELVAKILSDRGHKVGLATGGNVYVDGEKISEATFSFLEATRAVLTDPEVEVAVFDMMGNRVAEVTEGQMQKGTFTVDMTGKAAGMYLVRMSVNNQVFNQKVMVR